MKTIAIVLGVIGAFVVTAGLYKMATSQTNQGVPEHVREIFINWKSEHQKGYGVTAEESFRLQVFYENYKKVNALNARGGATFALNEFADLSNEEFKIQNAGYKYEKGLRENVKSLEGLQIPEKVDWEADGAVNTPHSQGNCKSSYAFSATGALEGLTYIKTGNLYKFSEQEIVDCSKLHYYSGYNYGCSGGDYTRAFMHTNKLDISREVDYPYRGSDGDCKPVASEKKKTVNSAHPGYVMAKPESNFELMAAISRQPVSVAVNADSNFQFYKSGVFSGDCPAEPNHLLWHSVLVVGYGTDAATGKMFYKLKNSWGQNWGQDGYIYLERTDTDGPGMCGVLQYPVYPLWS